MTLAVEHHFCNLLVQIVEGILQSLLQFVSHEVRLCSPSFETLGDEVVCESLELLVRLLHLVVLSVEENGLLDLLHVALMQDVLTNAQVLDAEVGFQRVAYRVSTRLINFAVEDLEQD